MKCSGTVLALGVVVMAAAVARGETPAATMEERVKGVVRELESDRYQERELGVKHLVELPAEALPFLDKARAATKDPEVIARIEGSIERLRKKAREAAPAKRAQQIGNWEMEAATKGYAAGKWKGTVWDAAVKEGLGLLPKLRTGGRAGAWKLYPAESFAPFRKAVETGCEDPVVVGWYVKIGIATGQLDAGKAKEAVAKIYPAITESPYDAALRLEVVLDYLDALGWLDPQAELWTEAERAGALRAAVRWWPEIVKDSRVGDAVVEELSERYLALAVRYGEERMETLELLSSPWLKARPTAGGPFALKTGVYVGYAQEVRGKRWADVLDEESLQTATARVEVAKEAAEQAYKRDVTNAWAPAAMVAACDIIGSPRDEMEKWYTRAMEADPDNFEACGNKVKFLRDHASPEETVAFGRQCVAGGRWQGMVPFTLIRAHELVSGEAESADAAKAYLQSDAVWADYEAVYTKFLAAHKGDGWERYYRSRFARDACFAERWKLAHEQFLILKDKPALGIFESMATYNYWRRKAERVAKGEDGERG